MDQAGVSDTNDPRARILWEREGRTVKLTLDILREPQEAMLTSLPRGGRPTEWVGGGSRSAQRRRTPLRAGSRR